MNKKIILVLTVLIISSVLQTAFSATNNHEKLKNNVIVEKLMDNAYVVTDVDYHSSNVLVVKMVDGTVFIVSSPFESVGTETLMDWVNKNLTPKKVVALNAHFHMDGSGGNEIYKKRGVEIWSSELTQKLQLEKLQTMITNSAKDYKNKDLKQRLLQSKVVAADNVFQAAVGKDFNFTGETVKVYYPGPAHSPDNVVVYFPKQKILFGGCMIKPKDLGYLGDADVKAWPLAAKNLKRFDAKIVVPGHGAWGGAELVDKTIQVAEKASKSL